MARGGLLIDYEYCSGCHVCEVACSKEHNIPVGKFGIKLAEIGPWNISGDKWQLTYIPVPTELCNLCAERVAAGKKPSCVHHCQAQVISYGPVEELAKKLADKSHQVLFVPK